MTARRALATAFFIGAGQVVPLWGSAAQGPRSGSVELSYSEARLTARYPPWRSAQSRLVYHGEGDATYVIDGVHRRAFDASGSYLATTSSLGFGPQWYGVASAGLGAGGFLFPRFHIGGSVARKWLARKQLVTTTGLTYYRQTDEHRDLVWLGSVAYYADKAIWEAGAHVTRSEPGAAISTTPFVSTRLGDPRRRTFAARVSYGTEAYARLGPTVALIAFRSRALSLAWREAVREDLTLLVQPEYYANPSYARRGLTVGAVWGASR